ncbi:hypothetical protein ACIQXU_06395 [Peribacillus sp. NPDC097284]|uniref:hypothetical protein n=1 Tax=Peribacillus sp. NPDC097284 TaxID=3364401 RepID=UPI003811A6FA
MKIRQVYFLLVIVAVFMAGCKDEEGSTHSSTADEGITSKQGTHASVEGATYPLEEMESLSNKMDVAFTSQNRSKWQNENQAVMKRWKQLHDQVGIANEEYAAVENELKMIEAELQKEEENEAKLKSMMKEAKVRIDLLKLTLKE